jgi:hypothetical protein
LPQPSAACGASLIASTAKKEQKDTNRRPPGRVHASGSIEELVSRTSHQMGLFAVLALLIAGTCVLPASGTPIKPDLRKLLQQRKQEQMEFGPARAGWDADAAQSEPATNLELETVGPAATARAARASLVAAAVPDWRAAILVFAVILLLRSSHHKDARKKPVSPRLMAEPEAHSSGLPKAA